MQAMRKDVEIGLAPGHQFAVVPDDAVEPVIGSVHGTSSLGVRSLRLPNELDAYRPKPLKSWTLGVTDSWALGAFASRADTRYVSPAP